MHAKAAGPHFVIEKSTKDTTVEHLENDAKQKRSGASGKRRETETQRRVRKTARNR